MTRLSRDDLRRALVAMRACDQALTWLDGQRGSCREVWDRCDAGDWLVWLVTRAGIGGAALRHIACDIAEHRVAEWEAWAADWAPDHFGAPRAAIDVARRIASGERVAEWERRDVVQAAERAAVDAWRFCGTDVRRARALSVAVADNAANAARSCAHDACEYARTGHLPRGEVARIVRHRVPWAVVRDALAEIERAQ